MAFKGLDGEKTHTLMDKFRQQCANKVIDTSIGPITMTFSCGVATLSKESIDSVLNRADEYLYLAKEAGRNQVISKG